MWRCVGGIAALLVAVVAVAGGVGAQASQWNIARVGAPDVTTGATIAVVDTGVEAGHPAFGGRVLDQINIAGGDGDDNGHGTHVAGIAAGGAVNCGGGDAAIGVAPGLRILPVRVLDASGNGSIGDVVAGIRAATDAEADVVNLSLGPQLGLGSVLGADGRKQLTDAIRYAWDQGSIPVLAAGNNDDNLLRLLFPAGFGDIPAVVVTATTPGDQRASYADSTGNARWAMAAPGGAASGDPEDSIISAWRGRQCAALSGTSMAAPHVSGALGVLRGRGLSPIQAVERVLATAESLSASGTGAGLLDVDAATQGIGTTSASQPSTSSVAPTEPTTTSTTRAPTTGPETTPEPNSTDVDRSVPSSSTTDPPAPDSDGPPSSPDQPEVAADLRIEADGTVGAPLAVAAGAACAAVWLVLARTALRLRR